VNVKQIVRIDSTAQIKRRLCKISEFVEMWDRQRASDKFWWWKANNVIVGTVKFANETRCRRKRTLEARRTTRDSHCLHKYNQDGNWNPLWFSASESFVNKISVPFVLRLRQWVAAKPLNSFTKEQQRIFKLNQCTASTNNRLIKNLIKRVSFLSFHSSYRSLFHP
jgi:hypothetical protein